MKFHEHLKQYRTEVLQIPQKEAASKMNINQTTLSNYELGKRQIPVDLLPTWIDAYQIDSSTFLTMLFQPAETADTLYEQQDELRSQYEIKEQEKLLSFLREFPDLESQLHHLKLLPQRQQELTVKALKQFMTLTFDKLK